MAEYEFHPLANIFPLIEGAAFEELTADVQKHGVREPVWLLEGKILDGRNRYRAARAVGAPFDVREYMGDDATAFVVSVNLHRRHLTESQRAMVAARLANLERGQSKSADMRISQVSQADAAEMLSVGHKTVQLAKKVIQEAPEPVRQAVEQGAMPVTVAAQVIALPAQVKDEIAAAPPETILDAARIAIKAHAKPAIGKPVSGKKADAMRKELQEARERGVSMLASYVRLTLTALRSQGEFTQEERELLVELEGVIHNSGVLPQ